MSATLKKLQEKEKTRLSSKELPLEEPLPEIIRRYIAKDFEKKEKISK